MYFKSAIVGTLIPLLGATTTYGAPTSTCSNSSIEIPPASNQPTGNPSGCNHTTHFFPQKLYHTGNSSSNKTFLQQYQLITDFYRPGGPILFYQGAETAAFICAEQISIFDFAKTLGALVVSIEHRYFGISIPYGLKWEENPVWPTESLDPLTIENVSLDTISLLRWVKKTVPGAEDSKAILFGGSYAGFLTVHNKNTYSDFFGALASSPPIIGQVSDPNDPLINGIGNQASSIYGQLSAEGAFRIQKSFDGVRRRIAQNDISDMKEKYNLCTAPRTLANATYVLEGFLNAFSFIAEFNWPPAVFDPSITIAYPAEAAINEIAALEAPFEDSEPIRIGVKYWGQANGAKCLDWETTIRGDGSVPYSWIRCHYLKHPDAFTSEGSIFGYLPPDKSAKNALDARCQSDFSIDATDGGLAHQQKLKTSLEDVVNGQRLVVSTGEYDSATGATFPRWAPGPAFNDTKPFFVSRAAHIADLLRETKFDREGVKDARRAELEVIKGWLGSEA
ncbi:serine carboxypeptidase S28-domain-containing protein [Hypoxylon trugodes]|uniref:serine carboxypeptidase S28-domain-containing protein n=1 Tax=Hypoxylon trugodes TaxID=326681 RepID=UPI002190940C|nr:serine carboxypeptidase S28-domain-containing protein [Hypoxylon trugodes]KAI1385661.1 serine carboxypeptidase S28-domain-containing protein [Hypoxylon trugodes]